MRQNRQTKMIAILALCVAIVGLTLGFAAFSNVLTISSGAQVNPKGINIKAYGLDSVEDPDDFQSLQFTSDTKSKGFISHDVEDTTDAIDVTDAIINNGSEGNLSISNMSATFTKPGQAVEYYFMVKNEGDYDAYMDLTQFPSSLKKPSKCTALNDTNQELVEQACQNILMHVIPVGKDVEDLIKDYDNITGKHKIERNGDYIYLAAYIGYATDEETPLILTDGPFEVEFDDIIINFSALE